MFIYVKEHQKYQGAKICLCDHFQIFDSIRESKESVLLKKKKVSMTQIIYLKKCDLTERSCKEKETIQK